MTKNSITKKSKKEILVFEKDGEFFTTSLDVAQKFDRNHKDVIKAISNLGCSREFNKRNYALIFYKDSQGREQDCYNISRDGFSFLVMGFTGKKAALWKERYINAFNQAERALKTLLRRQAHPETILARVENKANNKDFNEAIKNFQGYAKLNGSSSPERYYMIFNNMVNHTLFDFPKSIKNVPDKLSKEQLKFSDSTKQVIAKVISEHIKLNTPYKDVFQIAKQRAEKIADALGVTPIPYFNEPDLLML